MRNGVCLVSPDPVGPEEERTDAWSAFRDHATRQGWNVAVLAASESWLPIYEAGGMSHRYIGDEAVVDTETFSLGGGAMKGLRQAVNRIANHGYTISFYDPADADPALAHQLRALMRESRRGQVERGFSMTLSRLFDARDTGLLLAVCFDPAGVPAAFCQFVPAADIDGYSLDLMRRSAGDHPNGLTDFVIVRTIEHLRATGHHGLSLNFAAMRAVLAGEMGDTMGRRMEKRVMRAPVGNDADRVAVALQRQVPAGVAAPVPRLRLARAPRGGRTRRGQRRAVLGAARHRPLPAGVAARHGRRDHRRPHRAPHHPRPARAPSRWPTWSASPPRRGARRVRFTADEVTSLCPVTSQPDLSTVVIDYVPAEWCVESKSLKLYLWSFRDRAVFAEALAVEIADEIMATAQPRHVLVTLTQRPRGGITIETTAERGSG